MLWEQEYAGSNPAYATTHPSRRLNNAYQDGYFKTKTIMKLIKTILKLLVSVVVQILLLPIRIVLFIFNFIEKVFRILKSVSQHLIDQILKETIEVIK